MSDFRKGETNRFSLIAKTENRKNDVSCKHFERRETRRKNETGKVT